VKPALVLHGVVILALALGGCADRDDSAGYVRSVDAWHADRIERLRAEDGWLTLVGLHPLAAGPNTVGTAADADVRLGGAAPSLVGTITVAPDTVSFAGAAGVAVLEAGTGRPAPALLATDRDGTPTVLAIGTLRFHVIVRGARHFLRVKDAASPVRRDFRGIDRYPVDPRWRVTARLVSRGMPRTVPIVDVLGDVANEPSPGVLEFTLEGLTCRLIPTGEPGQPLFIVFADRTNDEATYGGGRFLTTEPPAADGTVVLDFNRAINPPCVFTPYATCPLPPEENALPIAVKAGEMMWGGRH